MTHKAKIMIDGEEFINCVEGDDYRSLFEEAVKRVGGEVALMIWKPKYGIWLREKLSISASISDA